MSTLFKATSAGRTPTHAANGFVWPAPAGKRPGKWTDTIANVAPCRRGYHLIDAEHLIQWLNDELWVAEGRGEHIAAADKHVFGSARLVRQLPWDDKAARLFAADCAEHVLHLFEREHPNDDRPRKAIVAARAYARDAAGAAAWAAAGDAASAAAWAAAGAAAGTVAWAAAAAASGAAWAAAEAVAEDAAKDAAKAAAGAAAGAAARAAAKTPAWAAAGIAERDWQTQTLLTALAIGGAS